MQRKCRVKYYEADTAIVQHNRVLQVVVIDMAAALLFQGSGVAVKPLEVLLLENLQLLALLIQQRGQFTLGELGPSLLLLRQLCILPQGLPAGLDKALLGL